MLLRGSYKWEPFLVLINRYVTGGEGQGTPKIDSASGIAYLGAGYWRAVLWMNPTSRLYDEPASDLYGVTLENPDRNRDEIHAVELGIAVLTQVEYRPTKGR